MTEFKSQTAKSVIPVSINAPVDQVFPLASPVEEYKWIPGWKCDLIHCPNDRVELGTIFSEISSAPFLMGSFGGETTWTTVLYDPENYKIHFRLEKSSGIKRESQ
ncbi:MAG: SRPBCC family protein [Candidatus Marinimicrobia bacterium]|nr:SRPBCC family protein [Candidatus Neomarinimicrobiota bacterium]